MLQDSGRRNCGFSFAVAVCVFLFFQILGCSPAKRSSLESLQNVGVSTIKSIVVSDDDSGRLKTITDRNQLASFARAVRTIQPYRPEHPSYKTHFYIELLLQDGQRLEFEFHTMTPPDRFVYIYAVHRQGNLTSYHGTGKCMDLFDWLPEVGFR